MKKIYTDRLYAELSNKSHTFRHQLRHAGAYLGRGFKRLSTKSLDMSQRGLRHRIQHSNWAFVPVVNAIVAALILLTILYWTALASDLYVSESTLIVQRTDIGNHPTADFTALLGNTASAQRPDQLLLREYLLSKDVLKKLDADFDLKKHYADDTKDIGSRLWNENATTEELHRYFLKRVSVELDEYASVLKIKVQSYTPAYSHALNKALISYGEAYMNHTAQALAQDQVGFLEKQVNKINDKLIESSQRVLLYQNKKGLISPKVATENIALIIGQLEAQRTQLETTLSSFEAYLVPTHPNVVQTKQQLASVRQQIIDETRKLATPNGSALNKSVEEFQRLEMELMFVTEVYKTALSALEKVRIEAVRNIKKVTLLQTPSLPEYAEMPRRLYNTVSFIIIILLLAGVVHLMGAIIRDHRD